MVPGTSPYVSSGLRTLRSNITIEPAAFTHANTVTCGLSFEEIAIGCLVPFLAITLGALYCKGNPVSSQLNILLLSFMSLLSLRVCSRVVKYLSTTL